MTDVQRKYPWDTDHVSLCTKDERLDRIYRDPSRAIYRENCTEERRWIMVTPRFWTFIDAREGRNPLYPGDYGYEEAPYEMEWVLPTMGKSIFFRKPEAIKR